MNYSDYLSQPAKEKIITVNPAGCRSEESEAKNSQRSFPVTLLPNPGEGGPLPPFDDDGSGSGGSDEGSGGVSGAIPVVPLPNPGEGGPLPPFDDSGSGSGGSDGCGGENGGNGSGSCAGGMGGGIGGIGSITLPGGIQGTVVTIFPKPVTPCFYCNSNSHGSLRFLNAAIGYNPFMISINNRTVVDMLSYAEISEYGRVSSGYQTISIVGGNGYIYVSKQVRITVGSRTTIAIVNTVTGLDFVEINDAPCYTPYNNSCVRAGNLSYNSGALNIVSYSGALSFENVSFTETTDYTRVVPGRFDIYVSNQNQVLLSTEITVRSNAQYTIYVFNWNDSPTAVRTFIVEDRK